MKTKDLKNKLMNKKWPVIVLIVLLAAAGGSLWHFKHNSQLVETSTELNARVTSGNIMIGFESDGNISYSTVNLGFGVDGTIAEILVAAGDEVKAGDIIARLEDSDYRDKYELSVADLSDAQQSQVTSLLDQELKLKSAEMELQKLRDTYQEMESLPDAYPANELRLEKLELENKELEFKNLQNKFQIEQNKSLTQDELSVKMALEDLQDTVLTAPADGVVLSLANKVGERVSEDQDFAVIHENNVVKAATNVIEYDIGQIEVGQKVYVTAEALEEQQFTGHVTAVDALPVSGSTGLVNYAVEVQIDDPPAELRDGMTCTITFVNKEVTDCLLIPYQAVRMENGKQLVTVTGENGQKTDKEIVTGFSDGTDVEVIQGLDLNETIVYTKK
ncbi:MAG TPA: HlyD family efflux transporter periplasmic adaptor subunit [Syntrophomonadaceae bacterium]|nr:HlyD family efflux transporter periplasmic adaptor subunit [Syntrophomonadaceae bacterium]HNX28351.1 HlyD family efflux transporter periplasmic adaptor subunit [Syntrophomonadaceae bacterium]HPR92717.1 HlyD family efflux transporter periplasmic adaptor subunit [Syntrophomonadaceae bacterium]